MFAANYVERNVLPSATKAVLDEFFTTVFAHTGKIFGGAVRTYFAQRLLPTDEQVEANLACCHTAFTEFLSDHIAAITRLRDAAAGKSLSALTNEHLPAVRQTCQSTATALHHSRWYFLPRPEQKESPCVTVVVEGEDVSSSSRFHYVTAEEIPFFPHDINDVDVYFADEKKSKDFLVAVRQAGFVLTENGQNAKYLVPHTTWKVEKGSVCFNFDLLVDTVFPASDFAMSLLSARGFRPEDLQVEPAAKLLWLGKAAHEEGLLGSEVAMTREYPYTVAELIAQIQARQLALLPDFALLFNRREFTALDLQFPPLTVAICRLNRFLTNGWTIVPARV